MERRIATQERPSAQTTGSVVVSGAFPRPGRKYGSCHQIFARKIRAAWRWPTGAGAGPPARSSRGVGVGETVNIAHDVVGAKSPKVPVSPTARPGASSVAKLKSMESPHADAGVATTTNQNQDRLRAIADWGLDWTYAEPPPRVPIQPLQAPCGNRTGLALKSRNPSLARTAQAREGRADGQPGSLTARSQVPTSMLNAAATDVMRLRAICGADTGR